MSVKIIKQALVIFLIVLLGDCVSNGNKAENNNTRDSLLYAIDRSAQKMSSELPPGSRVAIVSFSSSSNNLSDYIMEELAGALFDCGIEVADRKNLEYVYQELKFQMSGNVSEETAKFIGKFLGAEFVITGQLTELSGLYRYGTSAIHVEKAIRSSITRFDVMDNEAMRHTVNTLANQATPVESAKFTGNEQELPKTAGTFLDRGLRYAKWGEYEGAIADFTEAIKLNPDFAAAYNNRGLAYVKKGELDKAIIDYTQAIRLSPNDVTFYMNRGIAYSWLPGHDKEAQEDFGKGFDLDMEFALNYTLEQIGVR